MAFTSTSFTKLFYQNRVFLFVYDLLTEFYTDNATEDDFTATADFSSSRAAIKTAQDTIIDDFQTANDAVIDAADAAMQAYVDANKTGETITVDATVLKAAISAMFQGQSFDYVQVKIDLEAEVTDNILDSAGISKSEVITQMKADYIAARDLYEHEGATYFNYEDPRCKGEGWHNANQDQGSDPSVTTKIKCESCDGFGKTLEQNTITASYSVSDSGVPTV